MGGEARAEVGNGRDGKGWLKGDRLNLLGESRTESPSRRERIQREKSRRELERKR